MNLTQTSRGAKDALASEAYPTARLMPKKKISNFEDVERGDSERNMRNA